MVTNGVDLWVPGLPVAAERPRLGRRRKAFTPAKTIAAEVAVAAELMRRYGCGPEPTQHLYGPDQALMLMVDYSADGARIRLTPLADRAKAMRGDVDNYLKTTMDGLQKGGAFKNDGQIVSVVADKWPTTFDIEHYDGPV